VIWLAALHNTTAQLPPLEMPLEEPPAQGRSTRGAMAAGLVYGLAGAVERLVRAHWARVGLDAPVYLTGGAAGFLARYLAFPVVEEPDLVLDGLAGFAAAWWGDPHG
ncbi:MAG: type III pantothenate kinase, partial [Planctomycetota bacterium]